MAEGFTLSSGLEAQLYYTLTGAHGAHVAAGLLATLYVMSKLMRGGYGPDKHAGPLMLALYWGVVEIVWAMLYPMFYLA